MIDIHSHILPGMDDGAKDPEEAAKLIETLQQQGITLIALTPHFYPHREPQERFILRREKAYDLLKGIDIEMKFVLASETFLTENLLLNECIDDLCMEQTKFLLLELPFTRDWNARTYRLIDGLMSKFGIHPIIAHIERYPAMNRKADRENILKNLADMGCMFQIDTDSVTNLRTRYSMLKLIKSGWVDFIGSDCHDLTVRKPQFDKFNDIVRKKLGQDYLDRFEKNALDILK